MGFEQALRTSAVLLAATGFVGLLFARGIPLWLAAVTLAALLYAIVEQLGWLRGVMIGRQASPIVWNALLIGAFVMFLLDLTAVSRELLPAGIHFLAVLLTVKLLTLRDRRDFRHLYAISLMSVVASAALTRDLWYVAVFAVYLLAATWSLLLYHLTGMLTGTAAAYIGGPGVLTGQIPAQTTPLQDSGVSRTLKFGSRIKGKFFWLTNAIAVCTFLLTLMIFFLLPRISVGILQKPKGEGLRTTGFSERVDLGMIGSVKEDPQIVMRVELPEQPAGGRERLYLRGLAFDLYNGRSWSSGIRHRRNLGLVSDGSFIVRPGVNRNAAALSKPLRQDILLEPLDTSVLFAVPFAESINGDFMGIQVDGMTGIHLPYPSPSRIRYSVVSRDHHLVPTEQSAVVDYPAVVRDRYLQLPPGSERIAALARGVTDPVGSTYEKTAAVLNHLLSSYSYSLEAETTLSNHPIDDFLFSRKTGYCEHYATAMVLMLRSIGIPSRLVTGFLATEWNEFGGYYTVRQRDAHAWVEVYYPESGWITLDPTPSTTAVLTPSLWIAFQRMGESLRLHWDRVFIQYGGRDQLAILRGLWEGSQSAHGALEQWMSGVGEASIRFFWTSTERAWKASRGLRGMFIAALGIGAVVVIVWASQRWLHARSAGQPPARTQQQIVHLYKKIRELAARRGIPISPSTTPTELTQLVSERWTDADSAVQRVTALYCRTRFGLGRLSGEEHKQAVEDIGFLKRLMHQPRLLRR